MQNKRHFLCTTLISIGFVMMCGSRLASQVDVTISAAPNNPAPSAVSGGVSLQVPISCFRFAAIGGAADVTNIVFSTRGTGDWVNQLNTSSGLSVFLDDGDGVFASGQDTLLFQGSGASPTRTCALTPAMNIPNSTFRDLWIVVNLLPSAGTTPPSTFAADIASGGDVTVAQAASVITFGAPPPDGSLLEVVLFSITNLSPLSGRGGQQLVLTGSGFVAPVSIIIGGVPCGGTVVISADRTTVTGLWYVGKSGGEVPNQVVTVSTGLSGLVTTPFLFTELSDVDGNGGTQDDGGCSVSEATFKNARQPMLPLALALAGLWCLTRRLHSRRRQA